MKKKRSGIVKKVLSILGIFSVAVAASFVDQAEATPAFARQMQLECKGCHFQFFPKLNAMGRAFKLGGYTETMVDTIDGVFGTSLPVNLNIAYIAEITYKKNTPARAPSTRYSGDNRGQFYVPASSSIWLGGRVAENWGAKVEVSTEDANWETGKIVYSREVGPVQAGFSIFSTESAGPGEGQELFNTGVSMMQRSWRNMNLTPINGPLMSNGLYSEAQGIALFAANDYFFAVVQGWTPRQAISDFGTAMSLYYRLALTYDILEFDSMIGVFGTAGQSSCTDCNDKEGAELSGGLSVAKTESIGMDFQTQGTLMDGISFLGMEAITLGVYGQALFDTGNAGTGDRNFYGDQDNEAYGIGFDLGFFNDRVILKGHYLKQRFRDRYVKDDINIYSVGAHYMIAQNVQLRVSSSFYTGGIEELGSRSGMMPGAMDNDSEFAVNLFFAF